MSEERRSLKKLIVTGALAMLLMLLLLAPMVEAQGGIPKQFLQWAIIKKLTVTTGGTDFQSAVTMDAVSIDGALALDSTLDVDGATTLNSTLDVDGNVSSGTGAFTLTDQLLVDGAQDGAQLTAQGYTTQTNPIFVIEQSDGSDVFEVANDGDIVCDDGACEFTDNVAVTGGADAEQLVVTGYSTQTNYLFVAEQSDNTNRFTVDNSGNISATATVTGADLVATDDLTVGDDATVAGDLTVSSDATGGNAGARSQVVGMPAVSLVALGTMTNGSTESANYLDDNPSGEWSEVDAGTNLVVTESTSIYRVGTTSLHITFTDVVTDDGVTGTAGAQDDLSSNESIGFWIYSDVAITAGDFNLVVDDSDGTDQTYDIGAVTASVWTWKEIDISGCDANCDTMDNINIIATSQGGNNLTAANIYLDGMWKWDADDEEALGVNLVQDGVLSVLTVATAAGSANTMSALTEQTNYIVNYQSGNDVVVTVTDQSANSGIALVAYQ